MKTNENPSADAESKVKAFEYLGITIITDFDDLSNALLFYLEKLSVNDFGFEDKRIKHLPMVYSMVNQWEDKNMRFLSDQNKELFYGLKESVEKEMERFNIQTPEVFISK